jgi:hypothetical protein
MENIADVALQQKKRVLDDGYTPTPHYIYRDLLPELVAKYDGMTARDCIVLLGYFHAYVNGESNKDTYMWAYPNVSQIAANTGIDGNRVAPLVNVLETEGLLITKKITWNGHQKKMYMPLYEWKRPNTADGNCPDTVDGNRLNTADGKLIRTT